MEYVRRRSDYDIPKKVNGHSETLKAEFVRFAKGVNAEHAFGDFKGFRPVKKVFAAKYVEFLSFVGSNTPFDAIFESCAAPDEDDIDRPKGDVLGTDAGFEQVHRLLYWRSAIPRSAYLSEADYFSSARMALHCVGKRYFVESGAEQPKPSVDDYLASGCKAMGRNIDYLAGQFRQYTSVNPRTVLLAKYTSGGRTRTGGLSFMLPLSYDIYEQIKRGEIEDYHLGEKDILPQSSYLFLALIDNLIDNANSDRSMRSLSIVRTICYQIAALTPRMAQGVARPHIVVQVGGTPHGEERVRAYRFRPTGSLSPVSRHTVYSLEPPKREDFNRRKPYVDAQASYKTMMLVRALTRLATDARKPPPQVFG